MTRVLVVEDSVTQAEELRFVLESDGYEVVVAPDAAAALERMERVSFELVISDIVMPGLSGYDLCRRIKDDPHKRATPVILLTTLSDPLDVIQGLESGADNFITKPYELNHLLARVRSMLESRRLRQEGKLKIGVEVLFLGRRFVITSEKQQILDLLVSTFEDIVRTNRELVASQRALEAANRELEAFSYSVSHDLRAPLRAVEGFSRMLHDDCLEQLDDTGREYLGRVRGSARRMGELIEDLLELSRVTRADLRRGYVDVSALARRVAEELARSAPERSVRWLIQDGLAVHADANLLRILLENLLGNAWKFTRDVDATIELGMRRDGVDDVYFVRDNGAGFEAAQAAKLFAPFQRLHVAADFPGTGIGLATVQRIVHRHGGRVWADGEVGRGATFYFTMPEVPSSGRTQT